MCEVIDYPQLARMYDGCYAKCAELARAFNHAVVKVNEVIRFKKNILVGRMIGDDGGIVVHTPSEWRGAQHNRLITDCSIDLNELAVEAIKGRIPLEEYMKFYMQIGYSLSGYMDIFDSRDVTHYNVEYFEERPSSLHQDEIWETPIDYMLKKYGNTGLKI